MDENGKMGRWKSGEFESLYEIRSLFPFLTIRLYVEIYQDYSVIFLLSKASSPEHFHSLLALFALHARLWSIIDSICHHDWEVLVLCVC